MYCTMYCIDCCRASPAPLASGSANKSDLFLSHKVLYRSNITCYYHRFKYIPHEFATHVFRASICCVIQFGPPDNFGRNITMLQQSFFLHVVVGSLHGVSTCSFFEYSTDNSPYKLLKYVPARCNQPRTSETCRRQDDVCEYELQFLLSGELPVFHNLNY